MSMLVLWNLTAYTAVTYKTSIWVLRICLALCLNWTHGLDEIDWLVDWLIGKAETEQLMEALQKRTIRIILNFNVSMQICKS